MATDTEAGRAQPQTTVEPPGGPFFRYVQQGRRPLYTVTSVAFGNNITQPLVSVPGYFRAIRFHATSTGGANNLTTTLQAILTSGAFAPIWAPSVSLAGPTNGGRLANAGESIFTIPLVFAASLPATLLGTEGGCDTAYTSDGVFTLLKNGSSIGTATIPSATTGRGIATFSFTSGISFAVDDTFQMLAPSPQDATGADFYFSFLGSKL